MKLRPLEQHFNHGAIHQPQRYVFEVKFYTREGEEYLVVVDENMRPH